MAILENVFLSDITKNAEEIVNYTNIEDMDIYLSGMNLLFSFYNKSMYINKKLKSSKNNILESLSNKKNENNVVLRNNSDEHLIPLYFFALKEMGFSGFSRINNFNAVSIPFLRLNEEISFLETEAENFGFESREKINFFEIKKGENEIILNENNAMLYTPNNETVNLIAHILVKLPIKFLRGII